MQPISELNYDGSGRGALDGFQLSVEVLADECHGAPWDEEDGHGPVTDWTSRAKLPGELVLNEDRNRRRYYDFSEACRIARREGWNAAPYDSRETARQQAAKAARADFEHLRQWCNDQWRYNVVTVTASKDGVELGRASLGGMADGYDGDRDEFLRAANELAGEAVDDAKAPLARLCDCELSA